MQTEIKNKVMDEGRVPGFKKWSYWYVLVIGFLVLCIFIFYWLTKHFS